MLQLSQILGHSDQLYVKLPWGLRAWQFVLAISFTVVSLWVSLAWVGGWLVGSFVGWNGIALVGVVKLLLE